MDINHPVSISCQEIIVSGLTESNVLEFQKSFFVDRVTPYNYLKRECLRTLVNHWPAINKKYKKKQLMEYLSFEDYIRITQSYLKSNPTD